LHIHSFSPKWDSASHQPALGEAIDFRAHALNNSTECCQQFIRGFEATSFKLFDLILSSAMPTDGVLSRKGPPLARSGLSGRTGSGHSLLALMIRSTFLLLALATSSCSLPLATSKDLSRSGVEAALPALWAERQAQLSQERAAEFQARSIELAGKSLRWEERVFGEAPTNGHSLWISMHGGGNATARVNDRQWTNQMSLYQPAEGIYVAPRAPTDTWNLWHQAHIDPMFDRLIEDYVVLRGVNPDRVYLMGYSAGGDGVWQLAPRMADRWAAAAMMAGHPNDASLLPLRNLPFALFVGGDDAAYGRNKIVADRAVELDKLREADPAGYEHLARVYPGLPHWMNRQDAEAIPWMAEHPRNPWPKKIVWQQDDVTHTRFYWLAVPPSEAKAKNKIVAAVDGQTILLTGDVPKGTRLRLSDALVNLNQPLRVSVNGRDVFQGRMSRRAEVIRESLQERADPRSAATAQLILEW
jgi:poly(3-hydroxybutyrate) depolymerase